MGSSVVREPFVSCKGFEALFELDEPISSMQFQYLHEGLGISDCNFLVWITCAMSNGASLKPKDWIEWTPGNDFPDYLLLDERHHERRPDNSHSEGRNFHILVGSSGLYYISHIYPQALITITGSSALRKSYLLHSTRKSAYKYPGRCVQATDSFLLPVLLLEVANSSQRDHVGRELWLIMASWSYLDLMRRQYTNSNGRQHGLKLSYRASLAFNLVKIYIPETLSSFNPWTDPVLISVVVMFYPDMDMLRLNIGSSRKTPRRLG
jgi:hypothetical protein